MKQRSELRASTSCLFSALLFGISSFPIPSHAQVDPVTADKAYRTWFLHVGTGARMTSLPQWLQNQFRPYFGATLLTQVRFGASNHVFQDNAMTDCKNIYFPAGNGIVAAIRNGQIFDDSLRSPGTGLHWLLHELTHARQCDQVGGRTKYAVMWFTQVRLSLLRKILSNVSQVTSDESKSIHDLMPMEAAADRYADRILAQYRRPPVRFNPLAADITADRRADLIFLGQQRGGLKIQVGVAQPSSRIFTTLASALVGDGPDIFSYRPLLGDVNADRRFDLVFIGQDWSGAGLNIRTKLSKGDGTWTSASEVLGDGPGVHTYPALIGDVNGDNRSDLVFVGQGWSGAGLNIRTKLSKGDGTWTSASEVLGDGPGVHTYPTLIGDVNADSLSDLVFVGQGWSGAGLNIRTRLSKGDGTWTSASEVLGDGPGVHTYPTLIGNVDGDNRSDLVFVGTDWDSAGLNIRSKLSRGDGTWTSSTQVLSRYGVEVLR
jgi:hypothetical protein